MKNGIDVELVMEVLTVSIRMKHYALHQKVSESLKKHIRTREGIIRSYFKQVDTEPEVFPAWTISLRDYLLSTDRELFLIGYQLLLQDETYSVDKG